MNFWFAKIGKNYTKLLIFEISLLTDSYNNKSYEIDQF